MKTEEKARELASELIGEDQNQKPLIDVIMRMANWKEQQMIERACEWLKENMSVVNANAVNYGDISFAASKIIGGKENFLEQFKKAMKGEEE